MDAEDLVPYGCEWKLIAVEILVKHIAVELLMKHRV